MLRLLITFSTSLQLVFLKWKVEWSALALILTIRGCLSKELITDIIAGFWFAIGLDLPGLGFDMFKVCTTLEKKWLNASHSSSSLDMVFPSSTRLIFLSFDEFWVSNCKTILQKLLLPVMFLVSRFSK